MKTGTNSLNWLGLGLMICLLAITPISVTAADDGLGQAATMPGSYRITSEDGLIRFPFDLHGGDIRFEAKINGHDVHMLLDDGFMWDPLLFWGAPIIDSFGFVFDGEIEIGDGTADSKQIPARTASGITISFPGVEFTDQTAYVTAYTSGNASMWSGSVGQVSCTFLKHFVVDINFDDMMMTLIEPDKFEYQGKGVAVPWVPMEIGTQSIPATIGLADGRSLSLDLLMDLGYNDQLQISPAGPNKIAAPESSIATSLGRGIQGIETLGRLGRVSYVEIGGYRINNVISAFVSEEHADRTHHEVMVGLGILSRFNLVFDYTRERLFIEPNKTFADPYEHSMTGMSLRSGRGNYLEVVEVHPNTAAAEAGLQVGDHVTMINERQIADIEWSEIGPLFRTEGEVIQMTTTRNNEERHVALTLRRVI